MKEAVKPLSKCVVCGKEFRKAKNNKTCATICSLIFKQTKDRGPYHKNYYHAVACKRDVPMARAVASFKQRQRLANSPEYRASQKRSKQNWGRTPEGKKSIKERGHRVRPKESHKLWRRSRHARIRDTEGIRQKQKRINAKFLTNCKRALKLGILTIDQVNELFQKRRDREKL